MDFLKGLNTDDLMIINIMYNRPMRMGDERERKDSIDIVYKQISTGEKFLKTIDNPKMDIYLTKPEYRNYKYNKAFAHIDELTKYRVPYKDLVPQIAKILGPEAEAEVKDLFTTGRYSELRNIHKNPYVFGSDYDIENWYRIMALLQYGNDKPKPITKGFIDIEVDLIDIEGFPKPGQVPVNAVTYIDEVDMISYTFILEDRRNPQIEEFLNDLDSFKEELTEFDEYYGKIEYKIFSYTDEFQLIKDTFTVINSNKRDFVLIWNLSFDIPYLIERIKVLGHEPADVMCHPDFPRQSVYFKKDERNFQISYKGDYVKMSSYTCFLDQMLIYAGLRKGAGEIRSFKLSYVAQKEIGDEKLDYEEETDIKHFPYVNFRKFIKYNIKDVLLQLGIERRTNDLDDVYIASYSNATSYEKIFRQTVFLKNRGYVEYFLEDVIIGNNANVDYGFKPVVLEEEEPETTFEGALVSDPNNNMNVGVKILGVRSKYVFDYLIDLDFARMYPSVNIGFNIGPNTMYGKLFLGSNTDIDLGKEFLENYTCDNIGVFANKWLNLPTIEDLCMEIESVDADSINLELMNGE